MRLIKITIICLFAKLNLAIRFDLYKVQPFTWDNFGASSGVVPTSEDVKTAKENKNQNGFYQFNGGFIKNGHETSAQNEAAKHGKEGKENLKTEDKEAGKHYKDYKSKDNHHSNRHESQKGQKGAKFSEKEGHKRGHKTKGYHNQFFKDEYHKEHRFYDDRHKSGDYHKYGDGHSKFEKNESVYKKGGKNNSGTAQNESGKKGNYNKGHVASEHKKINKNEGNEQFYDTSKEEGKKHQSSSDKIYTQQIKL